MIDKQAIIHPAAKIADDVVIGPWSYIGEDVEIGAGTKIESHVVIKGPTIIGRDNHIFQFSSIGEIPQDLKFKGEKSWLKIGDRNVIREFCTFNRGTGCDRGETVIGNDNLFMAYVHIAHDCEIKNNVIFANNASVAGHVTIDDHVILGGFSGVLQFCRMGKYSFSSMGSMIKKDVPPYVKVSGYFAAPRGLNTVGLQRHGFAEDTILKLRRAYKILYHQGLLLQEAKAQIAEIAATCPEVAELLDFIESSRPGIVR